jgi:hypothetical protein
MNLSPETQAAIMTYLPWCALVVVIWMFWDRIRDSTHKKMQDISHKFYAMGSHLITELLDAVARSDRPAIVTAIEKILARYGTERGPLQFGWDVFEFWIDDALKDKEFKGKILERLEEVVFGSIFTPEAKVALGRVAANFGEFGLKSAQAFFSGLATGHIENVGDSLRDIVSRFGDPDQVDDEIVKLAPKIVQKIKTSYPEHIPALKQLLLTLEEQVALVKDKV